METKRNMTRAQMNLGNKEEAYRLISEGLSSCEEWANNISHEEIARSSFLTLVGKLRLQMGLEGAALAVEKALVILSNVLPPDNLYRIEASQQLADILKSQEILLNT